MSSRFALIIGNTDYADRRLARLHSPAADVDDLYGVLKEPELGAFDDVSKLVNQPKSVIEKRISALFLEKQSSDLLLLYFSGHGVRDEDGQLYLAVSDTDHADLDGTAVIASFITRVMNKSSSRRQILILDCCHSGAFSSGFKGMKGKEIGTSVGTKSVFETPGYGRIILTASDATQYAWEGEQIIGEGENSLYTQFLIQGMRTGEADVRGSGKITVDELHDYAYQQVVARTSKQRPQRFGAKEEGQLVLSKAPLKMAELPPDIRNALRSDFPGLRQAAIRGLLDMVRNGAPGQVLAAHSALTLLLDDDSLTVRRLASEALNSYTASDLQIGQNLLDKVANEARELGQHSRAAGAATEAGTQITSDKRVTEASDVAAKATLGDNEVSTQQEQKQVPTQESDQVEKPGAADRNTEEILAATADVSTSAGSNAQASAENGNKSGYLVLGAVILLLIIILALVTILSPGPDQSSSSGVASQPSDSQTSTNQPPQTSLSAAEMFKMGENYYYGRGVAQDYQQARQWFEKVANTGNGDALNYLGWLYQNGLGVAQDGQQARVWYQKAADAGSLFGMTNLASFYMSGRGGPQDYQQARAWYQKAADAGDARGMNGLGSLYYNGLGLTRDYHQASLWFQKAAAAGNSTGMYNLAVIYESGRGVTADKKQARFWYQKAADAGDEDAKKWLREHPHAAD